MKLHIPVLLRKALYAAIACVATLSCAAYADSISNHGAVSAGIGVNGTQTGTTAYGWANGLDFTTSSNNAALLGTHSDLSTFSDALFGEAAMPTMPTPPATAATPNDEAYTAFTSEVPTYVTALKGAAASTTNETAVNNLADAFSDLVSATPAGTAYTVLDHVTFDTATVYDQIVSSAYDVTTAGDVFVSGVPSPTDSAKAPATAFSSGIQNTEAEGYINVDGVALQFITSTTADSNLTLTNGASLVSTDAASTVSAKGDINVTDSVLTAANITSGATMSASGSATIVTADTLSAKDVRIANGAQVNLNKGLVVNDGSIQINGNGSSLSVDTDNSSGASSVIASGVNTIIINAGAALRTGNVQIGQADLALGGTLDATSWMQAGHSVFSGGKLTATEGDLSLRGSQTAGQNSSLASNQGSVTLQTDPSSTADAATNIADTTISAGKSVAIIGTAENRAILSGSTSVTAKGTTEQTLSNGETLATGVLLENTAINQLTSDEGVTAESGSILVRGNVSVAGTTLHTNPEQEGATIMIDGNSTLEMQSGSALDGSLSSADVTAALVKTGGDALQLNQSSSNFNGVINLLAGDGSTLIINNSGVGNNAALLFKDSALTVTGTAFGQAPNGIIHLGTINTTADTAGAGTTITLNGGHAGDIASVQGLNFNANTTWQADIALLGNGSVVSDQFQAGGIVNANGARIRTTMVSGSENQNAIAEQTRVQLVSLEPGGSIQSGFSEDMVYDVEVDPETGLGQRVMNRLNATVETTNDGVYLVYSKNYLSVDKTPNQAAVAEVLEALSKTVDHSDGVLASSDSAMSRLLDAFDYTHSGTDAINGLQSVSGVTNTLAQHAMMDSTHHHLDELRQFMGSPMCQQEITKSGTRTWVDPANTVWAAYTGGYDTQDADSRMGEYTRTFQGALIGYEHTFCCNNLLGISLGYENGIARSTATRFDDDAYFVDLYGHHRIGKLDHRWSIGMGFHDFDSKRGITVNAGTHTFNETAKGNFVGRSLNVGYELSGNRQISESEWWTPFLSVDFAYHWMNNLREKNAGDAGLTTHYKNMTQLIGGLGMRYISQFAMVRNQAPATFMGSVALMAEFADRTLSATNYFEMDPSRSFKVDSLKRKPLYVQVGLGLDVPFANRWSADANVFGEFGNDRASVFAGLSLNYAY